MLLLVVASSVLVTRSESATSVVVDIPVRPLDPHAFTKKYATCKSFNRKTEEAKDITICMFTLVLPQG